MTNKDIQQLIDRYLEGKTSSEEEKALAQELLREDLPSDWQTIRLMLGELVMGEAEYDAIMAKRQQSANQEELKATDLHGLIRTNQDGDRGNQCQSVANELNVRESQEKTEARITSMKWRWIAAASLLLLIGAGTMLLMEKNDTTLLVAQTTAQPLPAPQGEGCPKGGVGSVTSTQQVRATAMNHQEQRIQTPPLTPPLEGRGVAAPSQSAAPSVESSPSAASSVESSPSAEDPNLHYAALETTTDSVAYQDPARVDEFVSKLASVHALPIELTCSATLDSTVTSAVYVFPDKKEVDVFGRLLQVACCYSDETPGYLLNFSHLQFFFQLKDMRRQLQYLWIAERVNGKILLYSTHSPIGTNVSSACYQEYRDELMHTKSINTKTLDI